jgi:hypothetical protein
VEVSGAAVRFGRGLNSHTPFGQSSSGIWNELSGRRRR